MEFGAEFSGSAGSTFFTKEMVNAAFTPALKLRQISQPGWAHYVHLDPATSSHNYALCCVHKEDFLNDGHPDFKIVIDILKYWHPEGKAIRVEEIDSYVMSLRTKFHIVKMTYDQHRSEQSIKNMRKVGMPAICTPFHQKFKMQIYQELYNLMASDKILIPDDGSPGSKLLKQEMLNLQRKDTYQGWRVFPNNEGEVRTDDLCDALAAAVFQCNNSTIAGLPKSIAATIPMPGNSNQMVWNSASGPIGFGTGPQISKMRENINSWPNKFR